MKSIDEKIVLGVSSCLQGEEVRFDGGHKRNGYIQQTLAQFFSFEGFCPEVDIGLGIPRKTIRLIERENEIRCVGTDDENLDYTEQLEASAQAQADWHRGLHGYILKNRSPSCGMERVKVFCNGQPENKGAGIYARKMMQNFPNLPVEEEGRLEDPVIRENFIQRVLFYFRWCKLKQEGVTKHSLMNFHARHKLVYMSHDQNLARALGKALSDIPADELDNFVESYISQATAILKIKATVGNHVNVLQHIQGYLKNYLNSDERQELAETIEDYRLGNVPLIVPLTLLRHHFRKHPDDYIDNSVYMHPHPKELMLLNSL